LNTPENVLCLSNHSQKLKLHLHTSKKDHNINTYLLDIKKTVDTLTIVGAPITTEDHIEVILYGLPDENDHFIMSITSCLDPYSVDFESLFLAQEERFGKHCLANQILLQAHTFSSSWYYSNHQQDRYHNNGLKNRGRRLPFHYNTS